MTDAASLKISIDSRDVKDADKALNGLEKQSGNTERSAASMMRAFSAATIALTGTALIIKNSVKAATEYENALKGLASIARYAGEDINQTLGRANELVADGMLSVGEAATAMKNLLAKGFNTDQSVEMINRLKDAAAFGKQGSLEFGQAVLSATEGIKNENSILVDNAGVTKNLSVMVTEYAASVGKSVVQLNEAEKRQAIYNGLMRETEGQLGNAALAAGGMEGSTARMSKALNDSAIVIGQSFMPAAVALTNLLTTGLGGATDNILKPFLFLFESIGVSAGQLVMSLGATFEFIGSPKKWFSGNAQEELAAQFKLYEDMADESRRKIAERLSGISTTVDIGADAGKRRTDTGKGGTKKTAKDSDPFKLENEAWVRAKEFQIAQLEETARAQEELQRAMTQSALSSQQIYADVDPIYKASLAWEEYMVLVEGGYLDLETAGKAYAKSFGEIDNSGKDAFKSLENAVRGWGNAFTDSMAQMVRTGKLNFSSLADSIINDLLRIQIQKNITDPLLKAGTGFLGGMFGGGGEYSSVAEGALSFAGGGFTGAGSRSGGIDGMGGFPAILHPNETVIDHTRGQGSSSPNVIVNVINQSGQNVSAKQQGGPQFDGRDWVIGVVLEAADNNPNFRNAMGMA